MKLLAKLAVGGTSIVLVIVIIALILVLSAFFWGWLFMVIAGAAGWHIPFIPVSVAIGLGLSFILG